MNRQRYDCGDCDTGTKLLPEHPVDGPRTVRTGCPDCGKLTTHYAAGRP